MTIDKGAQEPTAPEPAVTTSAIPEPPPASPEALAPTGHDAAFEHLIRHVAAELPRLQEAASQLVPARRVPVPRSGIYIGHAGRPALSEPDGNGRHIEAPVSDEERIETVGGDVGAALEAVRSDGRPARTTLDELRVDVDGLFPTMTISGTVVRLFGGRLNWIARVTVDPATGEYVGPISYRDGMSSLVPHADIRCKLTGSWWQTSSMRAHLTFTGGGQPPRKRIYRYDRAAFRDVRIEYDTVEGTQSVTSYHLHAHPNRPADLPSATVSIEDVFSRQGLAMAKTPSGDNLIPISNAGANQQWSDLEMHDAMQQHWSVFADVAQWQVWTLFAGQHEWGHSLGGIMFDQIGQAERQGCAVFMDSFISDPPPASDPAPAAYVQRMRFWTVIHEIGHTFNLAHSWQKDLGTPWIPLSSEAEARSYMNYPYFVAGGPDAFFANFYHRFSDGELLFLRHAPERFVQQGNAAWFDHHGFEQARASSTVPLELIVRFNRPTNRFPALEPVVAEVKLKNVSGVSVVVDKNVLRSEDLVVVVERRGKEPRQWVPYHRYCLLAEPCVLEPGQSIYASLYLSAGLNGFDLAEPGQYRIYAALRTDAGDVLSAPTAIRVAPFASREQEFLADEVYQEEVGRVLAFGGSRVLDPACATLHEVVDRMPDSGLAVHAAAALARVTASPGLVLDQIDGRPHLVVREARPQEAEPLLAVAYDDLNAAANTVGHVRLTEMVSRAATGLAESGDQQYGADLAERLANTLEDRGVLPRVVAEVREVAQTLAE
jgi:hypothetical protein